MDLRPAAVRELLAHLERLPGVGPRSARRLVEHLLTIDSEETIAFAGALARLPERVRMCSVCSLLTEGDPCQVCSDPGRDRSVVLVVEAPTAAWSIEQTGEYRGLYHALLGHLSPLHGVGPEDLTVEQLERRVAGGGVAEVILATDATVEGETTALYLARRLSRPGVRVTRPASGIPVGGELATADPATLVQALQLRRKV